MKALLRTLLYSFVRFGMRFFAGVLALGYLLAPAALIYAASPPPTCQIIVNPTSISVGGSVTVTWNSTNATAGAITNIGNVGPTGSINLLPSSAAVTTYFGAFTGPGGTTNCQASVTVNSASSGGATTNTGVTTVATTPTTATTPTPQPNGISSGLVPCGYGQFTGGNESSSSTGCQACNLAQLIQNVMNFAIGISIPIAAALFAYAGFLYITSASNPANIGKAKGIFKNALIGFLIAITAWLIVNTLLNIIFNNSTLFSGGSWFTIQCDTGNRPVNGSISTVLANLPIVAGNAGAISNTDGGSGSVVSGSPSVVGTDANGNPITATGGSSGGIVSSSVSDANQDLINDAVDEACSNGDAASCTAAANPNTILTNAAQDILQDNCEDSNDTSSCTALNSALSSSASQSSGAKITNPQMASQLSAACAQSGIDCSFAQSIAKNESSGGANCTTSPTGAAGCMQVLATTACSVDSSIDSNCAACTASHQSLSAACAPVIQTINNNPQVGVNLGVQYIANLQNMPALQSLESQYGTCQITAAAYFQGPGAVLKAGGIPPVATSYVNNACR